MYRVELSKRALRDLRRIDHKSRKRLLDLLEKDLAAEPQPANLDIKTLTGRAPWLRLRRGEHHILYRPLTQAELQTLNANEQAGYLVERIIDRRDLEQRRDYWTPMGIRQLTSALNAACATHGHPAISELCCAG
jgi:mRNA-degrading endonuclease RelE of RelBE toxin-antitoxin system